jgi:crotonobetainyl-CoA:carnitine CoA-transferase CaiB-like acyl-CoA transferase
MSMALDGIRVLDLSTGIAGPTATMLLGDFGADVIKVEPPGGDPARTRPGFAVWNRNKRSIVVDQRSEAGKRRIAEFLAGADVCVVSQAQAALVGSQLDPATLSSTYPHLVCVHMPPYTPTDVPWSGGAESNALLNAFAGPACRQSSFDGGPIDLVFPIVLYVQGQWAAGATVAALIERERSGFGQVVSVAGIHGIMVSCAGQLNVVPTQDSLPTNVGPGGRHPCYTTYQGSDGRWLFLAALTPKFQVNAFRVLGVGDIFADERIRGISARILLPENRGWVRSLMAEAFLTRTRDEWLALLKQGDCPAGPLGERDEWLDHPQVQANDLRAEVEDPERGRVVMPGLPLVLTGTPGCIRSAAPTLGQDDQTTRPWSQRPTPDGAPPQSSRGPLAGYRVLNLGTILAGPYAGALLAELGADVVKVEPPAGDPFREPGFVYNRGQRGLAIDLTSEAARQAFYALVGSVDAVLDNSRLGVLERLQVDYASLARVNPHIVTLSVRGFGEHGPLAARPGFDPVLQAMSGMMTAQGGDSDPVLFTIPVNDIAAATLAVLGICLGLFHRIRTGDGQRVWTSLVGCSTIMQSGELVRFAQRPPAARGGRDFAGPSALDRFYRVSDGWLRVQAPESALVRLLGLLGEGPVTFASEAELAAALGDLLASKSAVEALACLSAAEIPAVVARPPADLITDPDLAPLEMFATHHLQDGTPYYTTNRYARFSRTQERTDFEPPGLGEHSREILSEAGVSPSEIDTLIDSHSVIQGQPFRVAAIQNYR